MSQKFTFVCSNDANTCSSMNRRSTTGMSRRRRLLSVEIRGLNVASCFRVAPHPPHPRYVCWLLLSGEGGRSWRVPCRYDRQARTRASPPRATRTRPVWGQDGIVLLARVGRTSHWAPKASDSTMEGGLKPCVLTILSPLRKASSSVSTAL